MGAFHLGLFLGTSAAQQSSSQYSGITSGAKLDLINLHPAESLNEKSVRHQLNLVSPLESFWRVSLWPLSGALLRPAREHPRRLQDEMPKKAIDQT